jgi:hypothetical protein
MDDVEKRKTSMPGIEPGTFMFEIGRRNVASVSSWYTNIKDSNIYI